MILLSVPLGCHRHRGGRPGRAGDHIVSAAVIYGATYTLLREGFGPPSAWIPPSWTLSAWMTTAGLRLTALSPAWWYGRLAGLSLALYLKVVLPALLVRAAVEAFVTPALIGR